jgi:hypothetical protein
VGLVFVHNYLMFIKEKIVTNKNAILLLDIRNQREFSTRRLLKSEHFDIQKTKGFSPDPEDLATKLQYKHVFIIGSPPDFDS